MAEKKILFTKCRLLPNGCALDEEYNIVLGSDIHDIHVDGFHKSSHDGLWGFWNAEASKINDWNGAFDYNPYVGRLPPGVDP